jgi:hypothetical protein
MYKEKAKEAKLAPLQTALHQHGAEALCKGRKPQGLSQVPQAP